MITFWPDLINNKVYQKEKEKKEKETQKGSLNTRSPDIYFCIVYCVRLLSHSPKPFSLSLSLSLFVSFSL